MTREPGASRALAVRWPVPFGALAVGCGLAVLVYQWGVVPLPTRTHPPLNLGSAAHVHVADAPPRTVQRPAGGTQELFVAVRLAPAAATTGLHTSSGVTHLAMPQHHSVLLSVIGGHPALTGLQTSAGQPPLGIPPTPPAGPPVTTDPGSTVPPGTVTPPDPGTPTDPGTTDPGTTDPGTADPGTTDPGTADPGTTDPGTPTDSGTTTTDPGTPTDSGTTTTDPGTPTDLTTPDPTTANVSTTTDSTSLPAA